MIARLAELHDRLDDRLERMLGALREMTEAQRRFRTDDEAWSPTEVAHHLLLAQSGIVAAIEKKRGQQAKRRSLKQRFGNRAVKFVLRRGIRVRNPAPSATPNPEIGFEDLEPRWAEERTKVAILLESMGEAELDQAGFNHPIAGPQTVAESLEFLVTHLEHHLRQLGRIHSHAAFPD